MSQCSFSANPVTPGTGSASVTMTIVTTARSASALHFLGKTALLIPWLTLPGLMLLAARPSRNRRGKRTFLTSFLGLFLLALLLTSCGGSSANTSTKQSGGGGGGQLQQGTQPGTYTIMVTGTSGSLTHQATAVTLIVN
jgi:hypothetical protein